MIELLGAIELDKYMGTWLEMARKPAFFQKACVSAKADYSIDLSAKKPVVKIVNSCLTSENKTKIANGVGQVKSGRELAVSFGFFTNLFNKVNYEIIFVDSEYQKAVVGSPDKEYLWILSRQKLEKAQIDELLEIAKTRGYDISDIIYDK